jgi:hypothetical protein
MGIRRQGCRLDLEPSSILMSMIIVLERARLVKFGSVNDRMNMKLGSEASFLTL